MSQRILSCYNRPKNRSLQIIHRLLFLRKDIIMNQKVLNIIIAVSFGSLIGSILQAVYLGSGYSIGSLWYYAVYWVGGGIAFALAYLVANAIYNFYK